MVRMDEIRSSEFRRRYATLRKPTAVTVLGRVIGRWLPADYVIAVNHAGDVRLQVSDSVLRATHAAEGIAPQTGPLNQSQRDAILRKINRH